jgi:hypothetical protein
MNIFSEISAFFSKEFHNLWTALFPVIKTEAGEALSAILPQALTIVSQLATGSLDSSAKRDAAVAALTASAESAGIKAGTSIVNAAIELAYQQYQATTPAATSVASSAPAASPAPAVGQ